MKALINKILPFSSVDGPGNRSIIFFQGCNFDCLYCHNPETINICNNCGLCINSCNYNCLSLESKKIKYDKNNCENCDYCLKGCKTNSSPKVMKKTVDELVNEILKYKTFISGITVSGGECTLQRDFLVELFREIKEIGLSIFVDTNGTYDFANDIELVNLIDSVMLDIKSFDPKEHEMLTGMNNKMVLKNANYLGSIGKLYEVRTVIVPNILDNEYNVDNISKLIVSIDKNIRYKIIKYRSIGVREDKIKSVSPDDEYMDILNDIAINNGCMDVIVV
jgi:pyruvate formate lyase activating enzyme